MVYPKFKISVDAMKWQLCQQDIYEESLLLFVTSDCNLRCENCFSQYMYKNQFMSMEQIKKIIDANKRFDKIDLMGGEPLVHPDINEIIKMLHSMGKKVSLYTNGLMLNYIKSDAMPLRACISFYDIESNLPSRKPITRIKSMIDNFLNSAYNKIKLILLLDKNNYTNAVSILNYIDENFPMIETLTIGLMRYENDYWNDTCGGVLSFNYYAQTINKLLNEYMGRLNLDIFTKGVLYCTGGATKFYPNRVNRFKCVFPDYSYSDCLFKACEVTKPKLDDSLIVPLPKDKCCITGGTTCLADKIRFKRVH